MPAARLFDMVLKRCIRGAADIDDVGDLPYSIVKPILKQVKNAAQLATLERNSPQLIGETSDMWREFIIRDIPKKVREEYDYEPRDPKNWYTIWKKLKRQANKQAQEATEATIKTMKALKEKKQDNTMGEIKGVVLRNRRSMQPQASRPGGSILLSKLRREGQKKNSGFKISTRMLPKAPKNVVTRAPIAMLENYQAKKKMEARTEATRPATQGAPLARPARPASRPDSAAAPNATNKPDIVERRRLSEAEYANISLGGASAAPSRKRPAPVPPKPKPADVFIQNKRRKIG